MSNSGPRPIAKYRLKRGPGASSRHSFRDKLDQVVLEVKCETFRVSYNLHKSKPDVDAPFRLKYCLDQLIGSLGRGEMANVASLTGTLIENLIVTERVPVRRHAERLKEGLEYRRYPDAGKALSLLTCAHHERIPLSVRRILLEMSDHLIDDKPVLCLGGLQEVGSYLFD